MCVCVCVCVKYFTIFFRYNQLELWLGACMFLKFGENVKSHV